MASPPTAAIEAHALRRTFKGEIEAVRDIDLTVAVGEVFFPLLFLTPNFVPFERLTPVMEALARANPVSYVIEGLRSLVIDGWDWDKLGACVGVTVAMTVILTGLSLRAIATYDR